MDRRNFIKGCSLGLSGLAMTDYLVGDEGFAKVESDKRSKSGSPNILFIVADDIGIGDLQCYGNPYVETPNLNQLAYQGALFTDYYAPSPLCAPARAAMLTGRYNHRTGAIDVSSNRAIDRIELSEKTMGDYFKSAGYNTAYFGKWHNGLYNLAYHPNKRGFDEFLGFLNGGHDFYKWHLNHNGKTVSHDGRYLTDLLNDEAGNFIENNHKKPFFVYLSHAAIHPPEQASEKLINKYVERGKGKYSRKVAAIYAMIEVMDAGLGRIFDKLEKLGLRKNTVIVFTSDNGAYVKVRSDPQNSYERFTGPYRGCKGNVLEQGIRVPAIVSWPGFVCQNQIIKKTAHGIDWLPSLYSLTSSAKPPAGSKPLDGVNIMPLLKGSQMPELDERELYFQKTRYAPVAHSNACIRKGKWKLYWPGVPSTMEKQSSKDNPWYFKGIEHPHWLMPAETEIPMHEGVEPAKPKLFNLAEDPAERHDLADKYPEIAQKLKSKYDSWFEDVMRDWVKSWQNIKQQEKQYWSERKVPEIK